MMREFSRISEAIETISSFFEVAKWVVAGIGIVFAGGFAAMFIIDKRDADNRIMTTAETLLAKIHAYRAGGGAVGWGECQVAADGPVKLLEPIVGHQAGASPELEAAIARELEPARG